MMGNVHRETKAGAAEINPDLTKDHTDRCGEAHGVHEKIMMPCAGDSSQVSVNHNATTKPSYIATDREYEARRNHLKERTKGL